MRPFKRMALVGSCVIALMGATGSAQAQFVGGEGASFIPNKAPVAQAADLTNGTTGTGAVVLANTPTLITPNIGGALGTSLALGGATIGANALAVTGGAVISGNLGANEIFPAAGFEALAFLAAANYVWTGRARVSSPADGQIMVQNNGQTNGFILTTPTVIAAPTLQLGAADVAAPIAQTLAVQSVVTGTTNTAGANLTIKGSKGTGTGVGGSILLQVAPAGSTGTAQNSLVTAITVDSNLKSTFAGPMVRKGYTVAALPASPGTGAMAYVTDATTCTFLGALTGGGALYCPVGYNGSAWIAE